VGDGGGGGGGGGGGTIVISRWTRPPRARRSRSVESMFARPARDIVAQASIFRPARCRKGVGVPCARLERSARSRERRIDSAVSR